MPDPTQDEVRGEGEEREKRPSDRSSAKEDLADLAVNTSDTELLSDIFGLDLRREGGQYKITPHNPNASLTELLNYPVPSPSPSTPSTAPPPELRQRHQTSSSEKKEAEEEKGCEGQHTSGDGHKNTTEKQEKNDKLKPKARRHHTSRSEESDLQESAFWKKILAYQRKLLNYFARNFYNMRMLALFVAFAINFILLFYKVSTSSAVVEDRGVAYPRSQPVNSVQWDPVGGESLLETKEEVMGETSEPLKPVLVRFVLEESSGYMEPMLRILAVLHTVISFFCIIGYYCLKACYS